MPTRNISRTAEQDTFVENLVEAGEYQNASEAVRDALRALEQRRREDALKLKVLRMQIKAGAEALKRGEFAEVDEADLEDYFERLTAGLGRNAKFRGRVLLFFHEILRGLKPPDAGGESGHFTC